MLAPVVLLVAVVLAGWWALGWWVPVVSVAGCLGGGLAVVGVVLCAGFREAGLGGITLGTENGRNHG